VRISVAELNDQRIDVPLAPDKLLKRIGVAVLTDLHDLPGIIVIAVANNVALAVLGRLDDPPALAVVAVGLRAIIVQLKGLPDFSYSLQRLTYRLQSDADIVGVLT
jgi:hypothetical protein